MGESPFGRSSLGLLQRLRPEPVRVDVLRDAAEAVLPHLRTARLRLAVERSAVVLEEDERRLHVHLADLAADMTDAGVRATPEAVSAALATWVAHRPVPDAAAIATGIAVLDWTDATRTAVAWRVVVRREDLLVPWTPSPSADARLVRRARAAAAGRAGEVALDLRTEGPVGLWSHASAPLLATAGLVEPERLRARTAAGGLELTEMTVVVTPRRPVACAEPGVAARLAGETGEACVILPWRRLPDLSWS
ncbi:hypothetical protein ACI8AF_16150 [Blastococcus sp. SYSU D00669]